MQEIGALPACFFFFLCCNQCISSDFFSIVSLPQIPLKPLIHKDKQGIFDGSYKEKCGKNINKVSVFSVFTAASSLSGKDKALKLGKPLPA